MKTTTIPLLLKDVRAVSLAMARGDTRYYLNGMLIEHNGAETRLVAADGHRLHAVRVAHPDEPAGPTLSWIVPDSFVDSVLKTKLSKHARDLVFDFNLTKTEVSVCLGDQTITSKLIDGTFPDYRRVIPRKTNGNPAHLNPEYVADALEGAKIHAGLKLKHNPFGMRFNGGDGPGDGASVLAFLQYVAVVMPYCANTGHDVPDYWHDFPAPAPAEHSEEQTKEVA